MVPPRTSLESLSGRSSPASFIRAAELYLHLHKDSEMKCARYCDKLSLLHACVSSHLQKIIRRTDVRVTCPKLTAAAGSLNMLPLIYVLSMCCNILISQSAQATPAAPTELTASTALLERVSVSWQPSAGANYYQVFRADSATGRRRLFATPVRRSFIDLSAVPNALYVYWVKACDQKACSALSKGIAGTSKPKKVPTPKAVDATTKMEGRVNLTWRIEFTAEKYQIFRDGRLYKTVSTNGYSDMNVVPHQPYTYAIKACNHLKFCSKKSSVVSGVALPSAPLVPDKDDNIFALTTPTAAVSPPSVPAPISFDTGEIAERCAVRWEDSHQFHSIENGRMVWKKMSHCIKVITIGPKGVNSLDSATQQVADNIQAKLNTCVNKVLNEGGTLRLFALVVAIAADLSTYCVSGCAATIGVVSEYVEHISTGTLSCVEQLPDFALASADELASSFNVTSRREDDWVYWKP